MKNESIKRLKELYIREHYRKLPSIPPQCRFAPTYSDKTANGLTKRINTMGRPIDNRHFVTDCIGRKRQIGSLQWIPSGSTPGSADISATVFGRSVKIEIKIGADRQSEAQKKYQSDIEAAGGVYLIVRTFGEFLEWYDNFIEEVTNDK